MTLKETVNEKWKEAFKARDLEKRTAYELIKQRIMVAEKSEIGRASCRERV